MQLRQILIHHTVALFVFLAMLAGRCPAAAAAGPGGQGGTAFACSIVAWDSLTGDLGVALLGDGLAAGSNSIAAKAGVGAVVTQGLVHASFGPKGIDLLESSVPPEQAVGTLLQGDSASSLRQIGIVDARGRVYAYSGAGCAPVSGTMMGSSYTVQGTALPREGVLTAVARSFEVTDGSLADRLLAAIEMGNIAAGGKKRFQSAALLVVRNQSGAHGTGDRMVDLRVDGDSLPLAQLRRLYREWKQTMEADIDSRSVDNFNHERNFSAARELSRRMVAGLNALLRERPDDPEVLSSVAWALAVNGIDRERALDLAKRAVKLVPANQTYLNTLAECHFQLGHSAEAIAIETELVAKDPANDLYWRQLKKFKEQK